MWKKFLASRLDSAEVWQIGVADLSDILTAPPGQIGPPPPLALCHSTTSEIVHARPLTRDGGNPVDQIGALLHELAGQLDPPSRPIRLECNDPDLVAKLNRHLKGSGTTAQFQPNMPMWEALVEDCLSHLAQNPMLPSLQEVGCSHRQIAQYAAAAAEYYRARLWDLLDDVDLIQIESPKPPRLMKYAVVLGAAGEKFGLGLYDSPRDHHRLLAGQVDPRQLNLVSFTYETWDESTSADVEVWEELDLPMEAEDAFPDVAIFTPDGPRRPEPQELEFLTLVLRGLAQTTEAELDSGRWSVSVVLGGQSKECVFSIPNLLQPPDRAEWMRRGQMPDSRSHELQFQQVQNFVEQVGEGTSIEELNRLINQRFTGPLPSPADLPRNTPAERAAALCQEALESFGRRRVLLVRQALAEDPNHVEASILLAESTHAPDRRLELFRDAQAVAAKALGDQMEQLAGHFWMAHQTRPYMRATRGLATAYGEAGLADEAADQFRQLLRLNPNDNQGVLYEFVRLLLLNDGNEEARQVLAKSPEPTALWHHLTAVSEYCSRGADSAATQQAIHAAFKANPHVVPMLQSQEFHPTPDSYAMGSREEAMVCLEELAELWDETDGYLRWLLHQYQAWENKRPKARRPAQRRPPGKPGKPGKPKRR